MLHQDIFACIKSENQAGILACIENGVDINSEISMHGATPLAYAVDQKNLDIIKLLLEKGAEINDVFQIGGCFLDRIYEMNNPENYDLWLEKSCFSERGTALDLAKEYNRSDSEIVLFLEEKGALTIKEKKERVSSESEFSSLAWPQDDAMNFFDWLALYPSYPFPRFQRATNQFELLPLKKVTELAVSEKEYGNMVEWFPTDVANLQRHFIIKK